MRDVLEPKSLPVSQCREEVLDLTNVTYSQHKILCRKKKCVEANLGLITALTLPSNSTS